MKRPFAVWVTAVLATLQGLAALLGVFRMLGGTTHALITGSMAMLGAGLFAVAIQVGVTVLLLAVLYAAFARPGWAWPLCIVYACLLLAFMAYRAAIPGHDQLLAIKPGAQAAGALVGRWLVVALVAWYAYTMAFGQSVRAYFQAPTVNGQGPADSLGGDA